MKNILKIIPVLLFFCACHQEVDLAQINGYWEIEKVIQPDGKEVDFKINMNYDYFEIGKDNKGFRKKVTPQLDGTFLTDDTKEDLQLIKEGDKVLINYTSPYAKWTEELITLSDSELVVRNAEKKEYHYKRANPINITNGETE